MNDDDDVTFDVDKFLAAIKRQSDEAKAATKKFTELKTSMKAIDEWVVLSQEKVKAEMRARESWRDIG